MKVGDLVYYRSAMGVNKGVGLILSQNEYWTILRNIRTNVKEHWCETLLVKVGNVEDRRFSVPKTTYIVQQEA